MLFSCQEHGERPIFFCTHEIYTYMRWVDIERHVAKFASHSTTEKSSDAGWIFPVQSVYGDSA